jgi:hypothetical protein
MTTNEIIERLAKDFAEFEDIIHKYPALYTHPTTLDTIISYANVCIDFHHAVTECECDANGIKLMFEFDNGAYASVIRTEYTNYEWEIMSSNIHNFDGILAHLDDAAMLETLTKISNGETIGDYSDCEIWEKVYEEV